MHWNSGIANLFFHLLSVGGTHPRGKTSTVVTGIGITNAARIWYRALTVYMTPSTTFADARAATINAANDLNSSWTPSVQAAWDAVGVAAAPTYSVIATHTGLAGATGATATFGPYDASTYNAIRFQMSGGTGDADLYVRFGAAPTTTAYDCRPYTAGNAETCEFNPSQAGLYYVMIRAYSTYSGVTLTVSASGNTPPPAEVCDDNIDNDGDGAVDCADSDCANDPVCTGGTWVTISSVDFESGWGPYIDGGNDARRNINDNAYAHSGNYCVRIRDNSSTSVFYTNSSAFNVAGRTQMEIDFWFFPVSFEAGEDFFVEVQAPGGAWTAVGNFVRGVDFNNNAFYNRTVSVDLTALGSPATVGVRFRADASANDDTVHMDDIVIRAR